MTNRIHIAMITFDLELLMDRNTSEVVRAYLATKYADQTRRGVGAASLPSLPHEARRLALQMQLKQAASSEAAMS